MSAPVVNGVCLSMTRDGEYCDRGEDGPHDEHGWDGAEFGWTDNYGTLDPRGIPKHPPTDPRANRPDFQPYQRPEK